MSSRLSYAQMTHVACKDCYDKANKIEICTISNMKNSHYKRMCSSRPNKATKERIQHDKSKLKKSPSQWIAYQDYYPLDANDQPIIEPPTKPKKQSIFFKKKPTKTIIIKKMKHDIVPPSSRARKSVETKSNID
eukprot:212604_1